MNINHYSKQIVAAVLLSGGVAVAGVGLASATAQAAPVVAPQVHNPLPTDNFSVPHQWCPGQPLPMDDVHWDTNVCHTWFWVPVGGMGNAGESAAARAAPVLRRPDLLAGSVISGSIISRACGGSGLRGSEFRCGRSDLGHTNRSHRPHRRR